MEKKKKSVPLANRTMRNISLQECLTDPEGSYTGVPVNPTDAPVQDADDL